MDENQPKTEAVYVGSAPSTRNRDDSCEKCCTACLCCCQSAIIIEQCAQLCCCLFDLIKCIR
jgi:hypothetical protein